MDLLNGKKSLRNISTTANTNKTHKNRSKENPNAQKTRKLSSVENEWSKQWLRSNLSLRVSRSFLYKQNKKGKYFFFDYRIRSKHSCSEYRNTCKLNCIFKFSGSSSCIFFVSLGVGWSFHLIFWRRSKQWKKRKVENNFQIFLFLNCFRNEKKNNILNTTKKRGKNKQKGIPKYLFTRYDFRIVFMFCVQKGFKCFHHIFFLFQSPRSRSVNCRNVLKIEFAFVLWVLYGLCM